VALIELLSPSPLGDTRMPRAAAARPFSHSFEDGGPASIVLPRPQPTRALPFLAQYIAQELIGDSEPTPRWRECETAYRTATAGSGGANITIDA